MPGQQIIHDRYIDRIRLQALLASKFRPGTYTATVRSNEDAQGFSSSFDI